MGGPSNVWYGSVDHPTKKVHPAATGQTLNSNHNAMSGGEYVSL